MNFETKIKFSESLKLFFYFLVFLLLLWIQDEEMFDMSGMFRDRKTISF